MSFWAIEKSVFAARPVELYRFTHASEVWLYCTGDQDIVHAGETYLHAPISRSASRQDSEIAKDQLVVTIDSQNPVSTLFVVGVEAVVTLTIFRRHWGDDETVCIWKGRVVLPTWNENRCELSCESIFSKQKQGGRGPRFTRQCRVSLYSPQCGVDMASFAVPCTVSAISALAVTCDVVAPTEYPSGYFVGGMLRSPSGVLRMLLKQAGMVVTLASPLPLTVGDAVVLYPGCDRTLGTCNHTFANKDNFRGWPWLPSDNPFVGSVI